MSLQSKDLLAGRLQGKIHTFEDPGDVLPMHRHGEMDVHIIIVARGKVRVHGPEIGDKIHGEGTILDLDVGVEHEVIGLTPNARIVNIIKG